MAQSAAEIQAQVLADLNAENETKAREITIAKLQAQVQSDRQRVSDVQANLDAANASLVQSIAEHDSFNPPAPEQQVAEVPEEAGEGSAQEGIEG